MNIPKTQAARAKLFKKLRTDAGLTQQEVADALGYSARGTIWRKENQQQEARVHERDILALEQLVNG